MSPSTTNLRTRRSAGLAIVTAGWVFLALAALALSGYHVGIDDQAQYLVAVAAIEGPDDLAGDPYIEVFAHLRSVFGRVLAALGNDTTRPLLCLLWMLLSAVVNAGLLCACGLKLLRRCRCGRRPTPTALGALLGLPMVFVVLKEGNWFGLVALADVELTATSAVIPLVFATILLWLCGRTWWALVPALAAIPIHGQTAAALLATWWVALALGARHGGPLRAAVLACTGVLAVLAVAGESMLHQLGAERWDGYMRIGRGLYEPLVRPWSAPLLSWCGVAALLALGAAAARPWRARWNDAERRLAVWGAASLALPVLGLVALALDVPFTLVPRLMPGRALFIAQTVSLIWAATWSLRAMAAGRGHWWRGALVMLVLTVWPLPRMPAAASALIVVLMLLLMVDAPQAGRIAAGSPRWRRAALGVALALAALAFDAGHAFAKRPYPWLESGEDDAWRLVQQWARANTAPGSRFVTPPYLSGFRVESRRPTFGEVKDGNLSFYAPALVPGWAERMEALGVGWPYWWLEKGRLVGGQAGRQATPPLDELRRSYRRTLLERFAEIEAAWQPEYLVTEAAFDVEIGQVLWRSERFIVRRVGVSPPSEAEPAAP